MLDGHRVNVVPARPDVFSLIPCACVLLPGPYPLPVASPQCTTGQKFRLGRTSSLCLGEDKKMQVKDFTLHRSFIPLLNHAMLVPV